MITIVLIHPGCTSFDIEQRIQGNLSVPLNRMGKDQIASLANELKAKRPEVIYSPEMQPDWECAQTLGSALETPVVAVSCLQNVNMGLWQGMEVEELHKYQPTVYKEGKESPWNLRAPDGETLQDAKKRVVSPPIGKSTSKLFKQFSRIPRKRITESSFLLFFILLSPFFIISNLRPLAIPTILI